MTRRKEQDLSRAGALEPRQVRSRSLMSIYRKLFSDKAERSKLLRGIAFAAAAWSAVTYFSVSGDVWALAAVPGLALAHGVSYFNINRRVAIISVIIAIAIVVSGTMMRFQLVGAVHGSRGPVALFLLISLVAAAFDIRTRASLYTQLIFASLIVFFASETAFGNEFAFYLSAYLVAVLVFLAASNVLDQHEEAHVRRIGGVGRASGYWGGIGIATLVAAAIAFLLLPWDAAQTPQAAQAMIIPFNGQDEGGQPGVTPAQARAVMAQTGAGLAGTLTGGATNAGLFAPSGPSDEFSGSFGPDGVIIAEVPEGTVAFIRSAVASYWRGQVLDTYVSGDDGSGRWISTFNQQNRLSSSQFSGTGQDSADEGRYLQTYFLQTDVGQPLTGYSPMAWALPLDQGRALSLDAGTIYQVVSQQPEFSAEALRLDDAGWLRQEYAQLPKAWDDLHTLTGAIIGDAESDFDKAAAIAAYLHSLGYDGSSEFPLETSGPLRNFVTGESKGSAIDFATASALMARSAGMQSRVVTGYLPGKYNAYSGASTITQDDSHAWAEIWFRDAGWVPFDPSSRPDIPVPTPNDLRPSTGFSALLDHRVGDSLVAAAGKTPGSLIAVVAALIKYWAYATAVLSVAGAIGALWWVRRRRRLTVQAIEYNYSRILGDDRSRILQAFDRIERSLAGRGFRRRTESESFLQYADAAAQAGLAGDIGFRPLALLASHAAYSQTPIESNDSSGARQVKALQDGIRRWHAPEQEAA